MQFSYEGEDGPRSVTHCTCCWLHGFTGCRCQQTFCPVCRSCTTHCSCSALVKEFHQAAIADRDFEAAKNAKLRSRERRRARRQAGYEQKNHTLTASDCVLLWDLAIRADEDIATCLCTNFSAPAATEQKSSSA